MDTKFLVLVLIFFLTVGTFGLSVFQNNKVRQAKAANPDPAVSENSVLFVNTDESGCNITAVARDAKSNGVPNVQVCINASPINGSEVSLNQQCGVTNEAGIYSTLAQSSTSGSSVISATLNGTLPFQNSPNCNF